ncbi:MAG: gliding motility-associated C-terminal domain-containing protein, partial [Bacteroidia bacterium]|nr:gliding motility-associated C-terminal domain-containing protein [Bacteroidia bacterium]
GTEYCYYIESIGSYSGSGLIDPIINLSQERCATPVDNVPPCSPILDVTTDCFSVNFLNWDPLPNQDCLNDVAFYSIFYTPVLNGTFTNIATINNGDTTFNHTGLQSSVAGCYYITATDSVGNESLADDTVCVDNCPLFELPNVFTPNADNINDLFIPIPDSPRFIESIDLKIYNRWGQIVFETTDPFINWDGKHQDSDAILSDGVYHYTCRVNEIYLSGIIPRTITGFVHILDSKSFSE